MGEWRDIVALILVSVIKLIYHSHGPCLWFLFRL